MEQNVRVEENDDLPELAGRWRSQVVLKRDVFSTIERGRFRTAAGEVEAVLRRLDDVPWWSRALARFLFWRERRALAVVGRLGIAPPLLFAGRNVLVRGWIDAIPLHIAKPHGDVGYFRSAKTALRMLHRAGDCPQRSRQRAELALCRQLRVHDRLPARVLLSVAATPGSALPVTRICAICSSTNVATLPAR